MDHWPALAGGMQLTLPSDRQVQGSLPSLYPILVHGGKLFWFLVLPQSAPTKELSMCVLGVADQQARPLWAMFNKWRECGNALRRASHGWERKAGPGGFPGASMSSPPPTLSFSP